MRRFHIFWNVFIAVVLAAAVTAFAGAKIVFAQEESEFASLSTEELESRLEVVEKEIAELKIEADYLETEPPDIGYDDARIEKRGVEPEARIKSKLLSPGAYYSTEKKLKMLQDTKEKIEKELEGRAAQ